MRVLVLGVSGMLGSMAFRLLRRDPGLTVFGTGRLEHVRRFFPDAPDEAILTGIEGDNVDALASAIARSRPDVIINCIGIVKQSSAAKNPLVAIRINSLLPHRVAGLARVAGARLIHISTDCVFSGRRGNYKETDLPDPEDLYGRSKLLGEVDDPNAITLRTSIIGREPAGRNGLVEWFLNEPGPVRGFTRAVFSGLTTDELIRVIRERVLPMPTLQGIFHVSGAPIDKYTLLTIVKDAYERSTEIKQDGTVVIDRSLDSTRFRQVTGYTPPSWPEMICRMRNLEGFIVRAEADV